MPLTLVLGPANSAKAGEVLGAYGAAARRGALLVVPTTVDARHYARELAEEGVVRRRRPPLNGRRSLDGTSKARKPARRSGPQHETEARVRGGAIVAPPESQGHLKR